jgi:hypothetical protein
MPRLHNPQDESLRVAAVKAALLKHRPWMLSTGPLTLSGKRKMAGNATKHGARSLALRLALAYCDAVSRALQR